MTTSPLTVMGLPVPDLLLGAIIGNNLGSSTVFGQALEDYIRQGMPAGTYRETLPRWAAPTDIAIATTGVVMAVGVPLFAGDVITNISFFVSGTPAGTPTAGFVALYDNQATPALLAQSADFATTARAANTGYTIPLTTPQTIANTGLYYAAISFTATTVPTLRGMASASAFLFATTLPSPTKRLSQTHGAAVGGTAPATIASGAATATLPWLALT